MNEELIKKLALQSRFEVLHAGIGTTNFWISTKLEKYTELMVQEFIRYFNEDYQRDYNEQWRDDLSKGIKQHFGVEE